MRPSALSQHEALPYTGGAEFVSTCLGVATEAVAGGRRVLMLSAEERLEGVRVALGNAAEEVTFVPTNRHGRNPGRIPALLDSFRSVAVDNRALALTDWSLPGRSLAARAETQLTESLLNLVAVQDWPLDVLCLYDTGELVGPALADMRRVHRSVRGQTENPDYDPALFESLFSAALNGTPVELHVRAVGPEELSGARELVRQFSAGCGLPSDRGQDLVVAANEVVTNSIRHGGGSARLALWEQDEGVVCQVTDRGHITNPLAGRLAPPPDAESGRGLWLANQLCDLVQIRSSSSGTLVRLYMDRL